MKETGTGGVVFTRIASGLVRDDNINLLAKKTF
jgi:hypothetical protein